MIINVSLTYPIKIYRSLDWKTKVATLIFLQKNRDALSAMYNIKKIISSNFNPKTKHNNVDKNMEINPNTQKKINSKYNKRIR